MRILLIDNTKPDLAFFTPLLLQRLKEWGDVTSCRSINDMPTDKHWDAIVLSGSSVNLSEPVSMRHISKDLSSLLLFPNVPILGICFGMQLMAMAYGGLVERMPCPLKQDRYVCYNDTNESVLLDDTQFKACFSHEDAVTRCPPTFKRWSTHDATIDVIESRELLRFGVQFHPEKSEGPVLERFFSFVRARATSLSPQDIRTIEDQMGRTRHQHLAMAYGVEPERILSIWADFRARFRIPAMLI